MRKKTTIEAKIKNTALRPLAFTFIELPKIMEITTLAKAEEVSENLIDQAWKRIESIIEAESKKAYLDGLTAGIEMTMKKHNIPKTIIEIKEN